MKKQKPVFSRYHLLLIFSCLSIALAVVSLSVMFSSIRQAESLRRAQYQYQQNALASAAESADSLFSMSHSLMKQFWHNASSDILPYIVKKDHSAQRILEIMRALRISQGYFSHLGFQLSIIDPEDARLISSEQNTSLEAALQDMAFDPMLKEEILLLGEPDALDKTLYYTNDKGSLLICRAWSNATPNHVFI